MHTEKERILKNISVQGFTESSNIDILVWIQTSLSFVFLRVSKYSKTMPYWFHSPRSLKTITKSSVCVCLWTRFRWSCHYTNSVTAQTILIRTISWSTLKFLHTINTDFTSPWLKGIILEPKVAVIKPLFPWIVFFAGLQSFKHSWSIPASLYGVTVVT